MPKNAIIRALLIIAVLLIVANFTIPKKYFQTPLKFAALTVFTPALSFFNDIKQITFDKIKIIGQIRNLAKENEELKQEILKITTEKSDLSSLKSENESLRAELDFIKENPQYQLVGAEIIGRDPNNFLQYATLNKGEHDGVKIDQPVTFEGFLVGKIIEVGFNSSKISYITNPQSIINSMVQESRATGLVKGQLGFSLLLDSVPQDVELKSGDLVVTSGLGGNFPKGLIIGEVDQIKSAQSDIFQQASVKPLIDFSKLDILFIMVG